MAKVERSITINAPVEKVFAYIENPEYTIPIPVLGKLAEALVLRQNEREADLAMANIKDRMEG